MAAYGFVAAVGFQLASNKLPFGINKPIAELGLLGATTSMAAASAYFLYILTTKFSGSSCSYCLLSAFLSFSLFFLTLKVGYVKLFILCVCAGFLCCCVIGTCFWNFCYRTLGCKR